MSETAESLPREREFKTKVHLSPEARIKGELIEYMETRGWLVEVTHGNQYQTGFPDLFAAHGTWGTRWIDTKVAGRYSFTVAQRIKWPIWERYKIGIWILTAATQTEYDKLFDVPNWREYWKPHWQLPDVGRLIQELSNDKDHD